MVQKKVVALEDRLQTYSYREADWENTTNKARKIERQLERLQERASLQRETITKLKAENSEAEALRVGTKLCPPPPCSAVKENDFMKLVFTCKLNYCRDDAVKWKRG